MPMQDYLQILLNSLCTLLNISYGPLNYPAFYFADTVCEVIPYITINNFDISSTAKFILSCLHTHLDCEQLFSLMLEEEEVEYCIKTLKGAIVSQDFKSGGFAVHELLQILTNFTHPSYSTSIKTLSSNKPQSKKENPKRLSNFDQKMLAVNEMLTKNCINLKQFKIIPLLDYIFKEMVFHAQTCRLLWNLLHCDAFREEVMSKYSGIYEAVSQMMKEVSHVQDDHHLYYCCLWLLGKADEKGVLRVITPCVHVQQG